MEVLEKSRAGQNDVRERYFFRRHERKALNHYPVVAAYLWQVWCALCRHLHTKVQYIYPLFSYNSHILYFFYLQAVVYWIIIVHRRVFWACQFKGIVSRDWAEIQRIPVNRSMVFSIPASYFIKVKLHSKQQSLYCH